VGSLSASVRACHAVDVVAVLRHLGHEEGLPMLVDFRMPDNKPVAVESSEVSDVKPSSVDPEHVTEVWMRNGRRHIVKGAHAEVVAKLRA
jgi:hypothetical protein